MAKLLDEIKTDLSFISSHTLQPQWYKILKVFILVGVFAGYYLLFGWIKTAIFFTIFFALSLIVHLVYRAKTRKWKQSWLDFTVVEEDNGIKPKSIGKVYYSAIILNTIISLVASQLLP
jgi:hypothetical protein